MPSAGKTLETALERLHKVYGSVVWVVKQSPRMRLAGRRMVPTGDGPPDFLGWAEALGVCFDAKEFSENRWPLEKLKPHQAEDMDRAQVHGAVSFLVIAHVPVSPIERAWFVPWDSLRPIWRAWKRKKDAGERARPRMAGLYMGDLERIGIELDGVDWLPALHEFVKGRTI